MSQRTTLVYRGPARSVSMLAEFLEAERVQVTYTPPMEHKDFPDVVQDVIVNLACTGAAAAIGAAVRKFKASPFGRDTDVGSDDGDGDGDGDES